MGRSILSLYPKSLGQSVGEEKDKRERKLKGKKA